MAEAMRAALALLLILTGTIAHAQAPQSGGVLRYAVVADAPTYDCHAANTFAVIHYVAPHYSTLLRIDPDHYPAVIGDLADRWEVEGNQVFTFHLHPGVRFHDGTPLTATDVKASLDRIRQPPPGVVSVRVGEYEDIEAIDAPDPATVIVRTRKPNASILTQLASPWNCIYSAALLAADPDYPARRVMGSGPFIFVAHVKGSNWTGRRNPDYFHPGLPYLDGFEASVVTSTTLVNALQGRQVQAEFRGISPAERDRLRRAMGDAITFQESVRLTMFQLILNTRKKPFDDPRVRRALTLALDRWGGSPQMTQLTIAGQVGGLLRPGYDLARPDAELEALPGFGRDMVANRAEARRLLREAGQEKLTFTLMNQAVPNPYATYAIWMIDQWRQVGVTVTQDTLDSARWNAGRTAGNFAATIDFVAAFVDEPTVQFVPYLSADRSASNFAGNTDRRLDDLYERQLRAPSSTVRRGAVREFERIAIEEGYVLPLFWGLRITPLATEVRGFVQTPSHFISQDLARLWLAR